MPIFPGPSSATPLLQAVLLPVFGFTTDGAPLPTNVGSASGTMYMPYIENTPYDPLTVPATDDAVAAAVCFAVPLLPGQKPTDGIITVQAYLGIGATGTPTITQAAVTISMSAVIQNVAPPANVVALVPVSGGGRLFPEATEPTACPSTFDITDIPDWSTLYITIGWDLVEIGGAGEFWGILRGAFVLPGTAP